MNLNDCKDEVDAHALIVFMGSGLPDDPVLTDRVKCLACGAANRLFLRQGLA